MSAPAGGTIDICVCTFQRPQLTATLRSLDRLELPGNHTVRVIVADNDETASARTLVEQFSQTSSLPITYVHAPARNISIARNACLDASNADILAFIDDDEEATPAWLVELLGAMQTSGAEVVLGPVRALYGAQTPKWMRDGDFHSTSPVWVDGEIRTGYTCNVLMRMNAPSLAGLRFNLDRGQTGGEDTEFFAKVHRAGGRFAYAEGAWVEEVVPENRARMGWLARRRFRMGQTHGRLLAERNAGIGRLRQLALVSAKIAYSFTSAAVMAPRAAARNRGLLRGVMHLGVAGGLLGANELRQYGTPVLQSGQGRSGATAPPP